MRKPKERAARKAAAASYAIPAQPNYHRDINEDDIITLQAMVDASKPKNFKLTPVSEAGW